MINDYPRAPSASLFRSRCSTMRRLTPRACNCEIFSGVYGDFQTNATRPQMLIPHHRALRGGIRNA
eukprot:842056-Prymnesium_polylepis.1